MPKKEPEEKSEEEKPKKEEKWVAQEIPTETAPMVVNTEDGEVYQQAAINAVLLNNQEKIIKALLS